MKKSKVHLKGKVTTEHPLHKLYEAASDILERTKSAYSNAGLPYPESLALPIWIDGEPVMRVTIEVGSITTADYAIFKAQRGVMEKNDE